MITTRLFVIEDRLTVSRGLRLLLNAQAGFCVVGVAANCEDALHAIPALRPDVVIADIDCAQFERRFDAGALCEISQAASLIILTLMDNPQTSQLAEQAGAAAVVFKSSPAESLLGAIREVAHRP